MPVAGHPDVRLPRPDGRATLDRMPGSTVPVIRQPFGPGDDLPYWALLGGRMRGHELYDVEDDPAEARNLAGGRPEQAAAEHLREALREIEAPADQLIRLGLA